MNDKKIPIYANFKRQNKWLGIIEYRAIVIILIYIIMIFLILRVMPLNFEYKIYIFSLFVIPVIFVLFVNINNENVFDIIINIINFIIKNKIYVDTNNITKEDEKKRYKYLKENEKMM